METVIVFLWLMWRCWKVFFFYLKGAFLVGCAWCPTYFQHTPRRPLSLPQHTPLPLALLEDHMGHLPAQQWRVFEEPRKNRYPPVFKHSHEKSTICKSGFLLERGNFHCYVRLPECNKKNNHGGEKNPWGTLRHVSCFFSFRWPDFF